MAVGLSEAPDSIYDVIWEWCLGKYGALGHYGLDYTTYLHRSYIVVWIFFDRACLTDVYWSFVSSSIYMIWAFVKSIAILLVLLGLDCYYDWVCLLAFCVVSRLSISFGIGRGFDCINIYAQQSGLFSFCNRLVCALQFGNSNRAVRFVYSDFSFLLKKTNG